MSNIDTKTKHLEAYKQRLKDAKNGNIPKKHIGQEKAYIQHLETEIKLVQLKLEKGV